jgi:O-antigen/teichoic acid export membrane protein
MSTRTAFAFSFVDRYAGLAIHVVSAMLVARLLTPEEIGVYSLTMVLVGFVATFRDLGAGQYLVQKKDLTTDHIRATWAVQLGLGLLFATIIAAASIPVATFYTEPRITGIMIILALNFALTPFQALPYAWLTRSMQFQLLAYIRVTGALAQGACAVFLAWVGLGAVSLAWANLAATVAGMGLAAAIVGRTLPWTPRFAGARQVVSFGGRITAVTFLNTIRNASPELFLGKLQGMTETGLFSRAHGLVAMFERLIMDAVNAVAFPLFAKQMREGEDVSRAYVRAAAMITALGWTFLSCLGILAFPVIRLLYGTQWDQSVDPTRWLAAAMIFAVPVYVSLAPMLGSGAVAQVLRVAALSTCISVACAGIGAYVGLLTLSQMLLPAAAISSVLWLRAARAQMHFEWTVLLRSLSKSALVAVAAATPPLVVTMTLGWRSEEIGRTLLLAVPGGVAGFCAAAYATKHDIWDEIARAIKGLRSRMHR